MCVKRVKTKIELVENCYFGLNIMDEADLFWVPHRQKSHNQEGSQAVHPVQAQVQEYPLQQDEHLL